MSENKNIAEKQIAKHKKHGWSYEKQLKELRKTEKSYNEKGFELSPVQEKKKELLTEKIH